MKPQRGFTLVEILIVVVILGVVAAIVMANFSNVTATAKASMLADNLRLMRSQIMVFKGQHRGVAPGYAGLDPSKVPDEATFTTHITTRTNGYGPYMRKMPQNPVNDKTGVLMLANGAALPPGPSGQFGWIYQASTLTFKSDALGTDNDGGAYFDY
jgi:general secretion pathway protein G